MTSLDEFAQAADRDASEEKLRRRLIGAEQQVEEAHKSERAARAEIKELQDDVQRALRELNLYRGSRTDSTPKWLTPVKPSKAQRGTPLAILSDTHFGEVVNASEMNGYNAYSMEIGEKRLRRFFERSILVPREYLAGVKYDGFVLALNGDIVSGDIHDELVQTNEKSTLETCRWAVPRLKAGIDMLAEVYGKVHVVSTPGNHGRNALKPRFKKRSENNADTHIAKLLMDRYEGSKDITFSVPDSLDVNFDIYGHRFSMEHGDQAKGGDGQVGALGPAKRMALRKQTQAVAEGRPFDYLVVSHFHQLIFGQQQGFVMNGSLKGFDEYAYGWHFKPEPAQQALMLVTPKHGVTFSAPLFCTDRAKEGW